MNQPDPRRLQQDREEALIVEEMEYDVPGVSDYEAAIQAGARRIRDLYPLRNVSDKVSYLVAKAVVNAGELVPRAEVEHLRSEVERLRHDRRVKEVKRLRDAIRQHREQMGTSVSAIEGAINRQLWAHLDEEADRAD